MSILVRQFYLLCTIVIAFAYKKTSYQPQQPEAKILGGLNAKITDFLFMVKLYINQDANTILCGGSYISPAWVLTASHCLDINDIGEEPNPGTDKERVNAIMGVDQHKKLPGYQSVKSSKLLMHPRYFRNETHVYNDVGLVLLKRPFNLTKTVQMISLPKVQENYGGKKVTIIGFGISKVNPSTGSATMPNQLQKLTTKVRSATFCKWLTKSATVICIGEKGKISCTGDSGGPMIHKNILIGVCSYGFGCMEEYAIYENVFNHLEWITKKARSVPTRRRSRSCSSTAGKIIIVMTICFHNLILH